MSQFATIVERLIADESGATMIEYSLLVVLISVVIVVTLGALGDSVQSTYNNVSDEVGNAIPSDN